jgi:hypothetical protein
MPSITVKSGDCLSSIAARFGFTWQILWDLAENQALRAARRDPNVLYPGDIVVVPEQDIKRESAPTEQRHVFELDSEPTYVRLRLTFIDEPRRGIPWTLDHGLQRGGVTDDEGFLVARVDPRTETIALTLHPPDAPEESYELRLGALDPVETTSGIQQRLANLGYDPGPIDGVIGDWTRAAVRRFQERHRLQVDGDPGPHTQRVLLQVHGG